MSAIVTEKLVKVYADATEALMNVDIRCDEGQLCCIAGLNGAGKATLLRILSTQLLPTRGIAYVLGFNVVNEAERIRNRIAVVPQDASPAGHMSAWQHVYLYLASRGIALAQAKRSAKNALELLDLWDVKDKPAAMLSGGQRKRIIVAMALATDADVIFLDEPTAG